MNLAMQLRRALITLGLTAVAVVCVTAKTAATDVRAEMLARDSASAISVSVAKDLVTVAHTAVPVRVSKVQKARLISVRCENLKRA
ncbi:MAG: hypothetical protein ABJB01_06050 [Rudaea sp.]